MSFKNILLVLGSSVSTVNASIRADERSVEITDIPAGLLEPRMQYYYGGKQRTVNTITDKQDAKGNYSLVLIEFFEKDMRYDTQQLKKTFKVEGVTSTIPSLVFAKIDKANQVRKEEQEAKGRASEGNWDENLIEEMNTDRIKEEEEARKEEEAKKGFFANFDFVMHGIPICVILCAILLKLDHFIELERN